MPVSLKVEFYAVCKNSAFRSGLTLKIKNYDLRWLSFLGNAPNVVVRLGNTPFLDFRNAL